MNAPDTLDLETLSPDQNLKTGPKVPSLVHEAQVTTLINLAARLTNKAARIRMGALGAWPGQIPLFLWLLEEDGLIQKDLVERSNMEQSTVAEHLDRMERDGFIVRKQGRDDKRKYRFYLTDKARLASRELIRSLETGAHTFTAGIPKGDLETFARVIRQIIANLDAFIRKAPATTKDGGFAARRKKATPRRKTAARS